jgi:hypothetical protein
MRLIALPEKSGATNLHHFNFAGDNGSTRHYTIGGEPVDIPDVDAQSILRMDPQIGAHTEPGEETSEDTPRERAGKGRRSQ